MCGKSPALPCAAEKSTSGWGRDIAEIQRSLSFLKKKDRHVKNNCPCMGVFLIQLSQSNSRQNTAMMLLTVCQFSAAGLSARGAAGIGSSAGSEASPDSSQHVGPTRGSGQLQ